MRYIQRLTITALAAFSFALPANAQVFATINDLGTLGGTDSSGVKVNNNGLVIGNSAVVGNAASYAFVTDGITMSQIDLGGTFSAAIDINESGQVAGHANDASGVQKGFVYHNGQIEPFDLGGSFTVVTDINEAGQVVGFAAFDIGLPTGEVLRAFMYDSASNVMTNLGTLGGDFSVAFAVNDAGQVIGESDTTGNATSQAFRWTSGNMIPLALDPAGLSFVAAINANGDVVGTALDAQQDFHAYLFDGATTFDIGTLAGQSSSEAIGLNDAGVVIGNSGSFGFFWNGGLPQQLSLGGTFSAATDINNTGQILGYGTPPSGVDRVFRYTSGVYDIADIGSNPGFAVAMNESGDFIGVGNPGTPTQFGFRNDLEGVQVFSLGGSSSDAADINENGAVTGSAQTPGDVAIHAYFAPGNDAPSDTMAPVSVAAPSSAANAAGWNNADVTLNLSATDEAGGSGVKEIHYSFAGETEVIPGAAAAIQFTANGIYSVQFFAVDNAGNAETPQSVTVKLDKNAATTTGSLTGTPNAAGWFNADVTLNMTAVDTGDSGVKEIRYSVIGEAEVPTTGDSASKLFNMDGIFSVLFWSVDVADNVEPFESKTVKLDKTAPVVTVSNVPFILEPPNNKMRDVTVSGSITDNLSGIVSASFSVHDEYGLIQPSGSVTVNADGTYSIVITLEASRRGFDPDGRLYTISVKGTDAAGNLKTTESTVVVPH